LLRRCARSNGQGPRAIISGQRGKGADETLLRDVERGIVIAAMVAGDAKHPRAVAVEQRG
jgi:hypothetical protein